MEQAEFADFVQRLKSKGYFAGATGNELELRMEKAKKAFQQRTAKKAKTTSPAYATDVTLDTESTIKSSAPNLKRTYVVLAATAAGLIGAEALLSRL